jgi:hypothetical protein
LQQCSPDCKSGHCRTCPQNSYCNNVAPTVNPAIAVPALKTPIATM